MSITLDEIKSQQSKVSEMIAAFEAQAAIAINYPITINFPKLNIGEKYVGAVISADSSKRHHVILMPDEQDEINWTDAMEWAQKLGGSLPNRVEQALLFATMKDQFKAEAYWSNTQHAANSVYAWYQGFYDGYQYDYDKSAELRARAVRRLIIQ